MDDLRITISALAKELGASDHARRQWWKTGRRVPFRWRLLIIEAAAGKGMTLLPSDFEPRERGSTEGSPECEAA